MSLRTHGAIGEQLDSRRENTSVQICTYEVPLPDLCMHNLSN